MYSGTGRVGLWNNFCTVEVGGSGEGRTGVGGR